MSAGEGPANAWAVHDCGYAPLLTDGRLIKRYDPAYQMAEKRNRDYYCLTERVRLRAHNGPDHKVWPGYDLGFFHSYSGQSAREYPGYPDCHIWGDCGDLIRELKRMGEVPKPDQVATLTRMRRAGLDVGVWWPCCWFSGRIDRELVAIAGAPRIGRHGHQDLPPQPGQPGYVRYDPGSLPPPAPAGRPRLELVHNAAGVEPSGMSPAVLELLAGDQGATGYLIAAGLVTAGAGVDIGMIRTWLRDHGVAPVATPFPLRLVVTSGRVYVHISGPSKTRAWLPVDVRHPFPADAAARVATPPGGAITSAESVDRTKHLIENHPANMQGATRR